jgi:hypothetical protein
MESMEQSMDSIWTGAWIPWTGAWNPYGLVHGIHMDWCMESIWTGAWNPHEMGFYQKIHQVQNGINT